MKQYLVTWVIRDSENEYDEEVVVTLPRSVTDKNIDRVTKKVLEAFYLLEKNQIRLSNVFDAWEFHNGDYRHIERVQFNEVTPEEAKILEKYGVAYPMNI